jgi:hypothetical protein
MWQLMCHGIQSSDVCLCLSETTTR